MHAGRTIAELSPSLAAAILRSVAVHKDSVEPALSAGGVPERPGSNSRERPASRTAARGRLRVGAPRERAGDKHSGCIMAATDHRADACDAAIESIADR